MYYTYVICVTHFPSIFSSKEFFDKFSINNLRWYTCVVYSYMYVYLYLWRFVHL